MLLFLYTKTVINTYNGNNKSIANVRFTTIFYKYWRIMKNICKFS